MSKEEAVLILFKLFDAIDDEGNVDMIEWERIKKDIKMAIFVAATEVMGD